MRLLRINAVLVALSLGGAVFAQDIRFNFDPTADFSSGRNTRIP